MKDIYTFSMIKPDAFKRNLMGKIITDIEEAGFVVCGQKIIHLQKTQAEEFYEIHKERGFFNDMISQMISYPVVIQVLKKENAVLDYRNLIGATNPIEAEGGTIRKKYAISIDQNSIHGSDSNENADREISFFFSKSDIVKI